MSTMNDRNTEPSIKSALESIVTQFFEMIPIRRIQWQGENVSSTDLDIETQKFMLSRTVGSELCQKYPPSFTYQRAFLKKLLSTLESFGVEICDELYEAYTDILQQRDKEDEGLCYKTYTLNTSSKVTIQESVNMISFGTTGLSTWQAAQHLAEWGLQNKQLLEKRHIVELGCGLGLTGLALCKSCDINSYTFTDCHSQVLNILAKNVEINFCDETGYQYYSTASENIEPSESDHVSENGSDAVTTSCDKCVMSDCDENETDCAINRSLETLQTDEMTENISEPVCGSKSAKTPKLEPCSPSDDGVNVAEGVQSCWIGDFNQELSVCKCCDKIRLTKLDWENLDQSIIGRLSDAEVVLAADVVYDTSIVPALVSVLKVMLLQSENVVAYVASTIRNEDTRDAFLIALSSEGLKYEQMDSPTLQLFHYDRSVPIEILKVTALL